jgi:DNA repair protein RadA/Sms
MARRMAVGIDQNRLSLLLAVLEKRAGLHLVSDDVFINIAGGMSIEEPAVDLGIVAAVASSMRNRPIPQGTAVFGEVGLGGEVRGVAQANLRIREAEQMGFTRIVLPASNMDASEEMGKADRLRQGYGESTEAPGAKVELVGVRSVGEALDQLLS